MTVGDVHNKQFVSDKQIVIVAASTNLAVGLVYQNGANGLIQVPTSSQPLATRVYFNPVAQNNSSGAAGDLSAMVYGDGAIVSGTADGAITVGTLVKLSANVAGAFQAYTPDTSSVANYETARKLIVGVYLGHEGEGEEKGTKPTDAANAETNCKFMIKRID